MIIDGKYLFEGAERQDWFVYGNRNKTYRAHKKGECKEKQWKTGVQNMLIRKHWDLRLH